MLKPEYSIQSILNMNMEDNVYRRCISEVKSPLQTFNISDSTIDTGSNFFKNNNLTTQHEAHSTISQYTQRWQPHHQTKRSVSRIKRKKIFDSSIPKIRNDVQKDISSNGCWLGCMDLLNSNSQTMILNSIPTSRSQQIHIKEYSPIENYMAQPELQSLYYDNPNIPTYEAQFIEFLLRIIPKLYLRQQLSSKLFVNKSQLLQSLLGQVSKEQKRQTISNMFSSGNLHRIDNRLNSFNLNQFINKLTMTSNKPVNSYAQQQVIGTVQQIISLLNQVEQDIRQYLLSDKRIPELQSIYDQMTYKNIQQKSLCLNLYQYLNSKGVNCRQSNIKHLGYIWGNIGQKHYTKEEFVKEIAKNDIIIKEYFQSQTELDRQLSRLGYTRNN